MEARKTGSIGANGGNRETTSVPSVFSMVWHDQFKTSALAQAATFVLVAADTCLRPDDRGYGWQANVNSAWAIATQAVANKSTSRANANKHASTLATRKLRQERHVYSHDVKRGLPSSVGAACGRMGSDSAACGSRPPLFSLMPLLRSLGGLRWGRPYYKHVAPTELSRDGDADLVFLARDTALAAPKSAEGWSPYIDNPDASRRDSSPPNPNSERDSRASCANTKPSMS